jgi:zinc/manganese transport system permease protein
VSSGFSWNLVDDVRQMLAYHFMLNALRAGTIVAVVAGAIGYLVVLRRQAFAAHTLSVIGFPGAAGAVWLGLNPSFGFFGFCIAGALVIAALPGSGRAMTSPGAGQESAVIGTVQAMALALGFLFVSLFHGFLTDLNSLLFGVITGVTDDQVLVLLVAGAACLLVVALIARPLLFSSVDPDVAQARGLPVRLLSGLFLVVLGVAAAGTSQVTGSLLVFALLVAPAATALRMTARPVAGLLVSVALSVAVVWIGETIAFFTPYPIGFWVTTLAFAGYLLATGYRHIADRHASRPPRGVLTTASA